jgi:hypothetical protein
MKSKLNTNTLAGATSEYLQRRQFLKFIGGTMSAVAIVTACKKDDNDSSSGDNGVPLGADDIGILNYAYALEQLEAAFYTQVVASLYSGASATEQAYLTDIRDHEIAHREFFKTALGDKAIPALEVNFSSINFGSRESVLGTARAFEDLGVAAYNGAGQLIKSPDYLLLAGKIVSVEARHAATIRDLISNGTFADDTVVDPNGLDKSMSPSEVLNIAKDYLKSKIDASQLPAS